MRKRSISIRRTVAIISFLFVTIIVFGQSSTVGKLSKSIFTLNTFKEGRLLSSSQGFFISNEGDAISVWKPFIGADSAIVMDEKNNKYEVLSLLGASELYDICRFKVSIAKATGVPITSKILSNGTKTYVVNTANKSKMTTLTVDKSELFNDNLNYYIYKGEIEEECLGSPVSNERGEVIGIIQKSSEGIPVSVDVSFAMDFKTEGLSINDKVLSTSEIRLAVPDNMEQASLMLILASNTYSPKKYEALVDEFISKYPKSVEGYNAKANLLFLSTKYTDADNFMKVAINKVEQKDEAHYGYARLIYNKATSINDSIYSVWTLDKAMAEVKQAYQIKPLPIYRSLEGQILYSQKNYKSAYETFMSLTKTEMRNGELFYQAAQCLSQLKSPQSEILSLLDSAVNAQSGALAAPYIYARANELYDMSEYRRALADYNAYDSLVQGRASHDFYYSRYLCELKVRQYQQALNDIAHAIILNRGEIAYYAELSQLQLQLSQAENALHTAELGLSLTPEYTDLLLLKGLALVHLNRKSEAFEIFNKVKELGDTRADSYMEKYR